MNWICRYRLPLLRIALVCHHSYVCATSLLTAAVPLSGAVIGTTQAFATLSDRAQLQMEAISFLLLALAVCTWAVRGLWNYLQRDFTRLPRLTFGKAAVLVLISGLLLNVMLTMVFGARELIMPGAWTLPAAPDRLATGAGTRGESDSDQELTVTRQRHLEQLRTVFWNLAARQNGKFPGSLLENSIASQERQLPRSEGMLYLYVSGMTAGDRTDRNFRAVLAFEPRIYGDDQFVLLANGEILRMPPDKLRRALAKNGGEHRGAAIRATEPGGKP